MKELDLVWGQPSFLAECWENAGWKAPKDVPIDVEHLRYQHDNSTKRLETAIRALHKGPYKNIKDSSNYALVIGNGASQVLDAYGSVVGANARISYDTPHWPRFSILLNRADSYKSRPTVKLVNYPNNPDGTLNDLSIASIVDGSYHWPTYYRNGEVLKPLINETLVFSLAKLAGFASTRLGWAFVKDRKLAASMENYIEMTTGSVSLESQYKAVAILKDISSLEILEKAQVVLEGRWQQLEEYFPGTRRGMFLYISDPEYKFEAMHIKGQRGKVFGETSDKMIRINIGCSTEDFNELMKRISFMGGLL